MGYPGVVALPAGSAPNLLNKSFSVSVDIEVGKGSGDGAIWSMGGLDGGYGLYIRQGRAVFVGNFLGRTRARATSSSALPAGPVKLRADFVYDGGGIGKGGKLALFVNDKPAGEARLEQTQAITLGLGGCLDVGEDSGSPVDDAYAPPYRYAGTIKQVTVDLK